MQGSRRHTPRSYSTRVSWRSDRNGQILHEIPISRVFSLLLFFLSRHRKNREAASELLMRLKDNRDLQKFLQDCQEVNDGLSLLSLDAVSLDEPARPACARTECAAWGSRLVH